MLILLLVYEMRVKHPVLTKLSACGTLVPMKSLTKLQKKVFAYLQAYAREKGYPPTIREIKTALHLSGHSSIQNALFVLEKKGYMRRSGKARGIEFCQSHRTHQPAQLPLAGRIQAGEPHMAIEDVEGYVAVDRSFVSGSDNFLLKVEGDSMIDAHIQDGDYVVVKPQPEANNGDTVVAIIDDEATVKKFYKNGNQIRLNPANPDYKPIVIDSGNPNVSIVGKVASVLRSISTK